MQSENLPKPLALGDILSKAWTIFSENFRLIALIIFATYVPMNIMAEYSAHVGKEGPAYLWLIQLALALVSVVSSIAIIQVAKKYADSAPLGEPSEELQKAAGLWLPVMKTAIINGIYTILLSLIFLVPGIIYGLYWTFSIYVTVFTGKSGKEAMDHSKRLVKGRWWQTAGFLFVVGVIQGVSVIVASLLGVFTSSLVDANGGILSIVIRVAFSTIGSLGIGYFIVASTVMYLGYEATKAESEPAAETAAA